MNNQIRHTFLFLGIFLWSIALVHAGEMQTPVDEQDQMSSTTTVKGIVTGNADESYYLRTEDGRQVIIQTNPDTKMNESVKRGDWIEATILPNDNATSVKKIKRPETN